MRVGIYTRVSTEDQTTANQLPPLQQHAAARGWTLTQVYTDTISGSKDRRPGLDALMQAAKRREFDVVLVWKIDRLGRSLTHLLRTLEDFRALGIDFVSLSQPIDTTTPTGKLMFQILAAFAEFEREMIRERTRAGLKRARSEGKELGRPKKVFRRDEAERLRASGLSLRQIAHKLGVNHQTIANALNS